MEDQVSVLPDEIFCTILSLLTMKEAARTSVLSCRWENLWKYFTGSLDFDGSKTMARMMQELKPSSLVIERANYINWVNRVLNLHQGQDIEEFRVCFDLDKNFADIIDGWINFAIKKRVRRLELDLLDYNGSGDQSYTFPLSSLHVVSVSSLTALCLRKVDMTDEVLAHFLSNCPLIEELSLVKSQSLVNVKIAGALKLKRLELILCFSLQNVQISAVNLVSFKYFGPFINNPFENVPLLSEVSIGGSYCESVVYTSFCYLSGVLYQLETLVLSLNLLYGDRSHFTPTTFPEFRNLKNLELQVMAYPDQSILCLNSLICASPCLYKLLLKLSYPTRGYSAPEPASNELGCWRGGSRLECLKVVEIVGWDGNTSDTQLAVYLLESAVSLEKIIIDPRYPSVLSRCGFRNWRTKIYDAAGKRERAKLLETKLPPGTELLIL